MSHALVTLVAVVACGQGLWAQSASTAQSQPAAEKAPTTVASSAPADKTFVVVFDFAGDDRLGPQLADSIRLALRRHDELDVLDRLSTQQAAGPMGVDAEAAGVSRLLRQTLAGEVALFGSVSRKGSAVTARVRCIDLRGLGSEGWTKTFTDDTERARAVISAAAVEAFRGQAQWTPPQYGDEPEPPSDKLGKPLNANGSFDGQGGWEVADNAGTFIQPLAGRGNVLRLRTDIERDKWLAYRRDLLMGKADPSRPPQLKRDTSYGCVGGLEGVHHRSEYIKATPGQRYWLLVDAKTAGGTPKVFVKGFTRTEHAMDGLSEVAMSQMNITPEQFAQMPPQRRKELIAADAAKHPERYMRESYRWYLNLRDGKDQWTHYAAVFPPRGGLPANIDVLQIQIYAYWPPGEYLFDNVNLYADPAQQTPAPEQRPRTPNFGKTSDVVERQTSGQ